MLRFHLSVTFVVLKGKTINKEFLRRLLYSIRQSGIDPITVLNFPRNVTKFLVSYIGFRKLRPTGKITISLALGESRQSAGTADGHYFWQDLICARWIYVKSPKNHLDVGSRIDGFVSHLLTFMNVTLFDIRNNRNKILGLSFTKIDVQDKVKIQKYLQTFDSVSSLHAIEHFGLGRYGDSLDTEGHTKGLINISSCVKKNGHLYLSFPVGKNEIQFNAQRIIEPDWPIKILTGFVLEEMILIPWRGEPATIRDITEVDMTKEGQAMLYRFRRVS